MWRRRRPAAWALALIVLALLLWADRSGLILYDGGDLRVYDGQTFLVDRVIDGDTLDIRHPDGDRPTTRIRFWGVNAPEHARGKDSAADPWADEATRLVRERCLGVPVTLHLEPQRLRGRYQRVLAHVELPDGTLLSEVLLAAGLAEADERWSHRHLDRFALIERQAKSDKLGIWSGK